MDLIHAYDLSTTQERLFLAYLLEKGAETLKKPVLADMTLSGAITQEQQASEFYDIVKEIEKLSASKANRRKLTAY